MKYASRENTYTVHSRFNEPAVTVEPGEEFVVQTELCSGDWLESVEDTWSPDKAWGPNPTVVIEVREAEPGSILAVEILDIEVDSVGYTGFDGRRHHLAHLISNREWGFNTKTVEIRDGYIEWEKGLRLPVEPMIGTLGTAPEKEILENSKGGSHGGNMDVNEVTTGATVYLPVAVRGGLLHVGDVHARQGDGEINGAGGIECRSEVRLRVELKKRPSSMEWVRIENETHIMSVACCRSVEESFYAATRELLGWMVEEYDFSAEEAYLLLGQLMEARATQYVNPTRTYICSMPKAYL